METIVYWKWRFYYIIITYISLIVLFSFELFLFKQFSRETQKIFYWTNNGSSREKHLLFNNYK